MRIKTRLLGSFGLVLLLCAATGFVGVQKLADGNVRMTDFIGGPFETAGTLARLRADAAAAQQAVSDVVMSNDPDVMATARQTFDRRYKAVLASIERYDASATEAEKVATSALAQTLDQFQKRAVASMDLAQLNERKRTSDTIINVSGPMFDLLDMSAASLRDEIVLFGGSEAAVTLGGQLRSDIMNFRRMFTLSLAVTDETRLLKIQANAERLGGVIDRKLAQIDKILKVVNAGAPALPRVQARWNEVKPMGLTNLALGVSNSTFKAGEIHRKEITLLFQMIEGEIAAIVAGETARASALVDGSADAYIASTIARDLKLAIHHAENIGRGDISQPIPHHSRDELGLLMTAMASMRSKLNAIVSEVRKLAERSQEAAVEIGHLAVSTLATSEDAGLKLRDLVPDIQRTAELVSEISAACREQSVGIGQINQAIQQLDQVTQANAGAANEMNATAEALSSEALLINERTGFFQVEAGGSASKDAKPASAEAPRDRTPNVVRMPAPTSPGRSQTSQPTRNTSGIDLSLDDESGFERISA